MTNQEDIFILPKDKQLEALEVVIDSLSKLVKIGNSEIAMGAMLMTLALIPVAESLKNEIEQESLDELAKDLNI